MEKELWKSIDGYELTYQVSSFGNVRNVIKNKILSPCKKNNEYLYFSLSKNGRKNFYAHRLVAAAFLENKFYYKCVDHIDGNVKNNNLSNLRWCSHRQNSNFDNVKRKKTSNYTGVSFHKRDNRFQSYINIGKNQIYLGSSKSEVDCYNLYKKALQLNFKTETNEN